MTASFLSTLELIHYFLNILSSCSRNDRIVLESSILQLLPDGGQNLEPLLVGQVNRLSCTSQYNKPFDPGFSQVNRVSSLSF